jgi:peptidyl-tRNA hydrolase
MAAGLLAAQTAHASDAFMRKKIAEGKKFTAIEKEWVAAPYISVLAVNNLEELRVVIQDAEQNGLPVHKWVDTIPSTVQKNSFIPQVLVGISIGPADFDAIKAVTGYLPRFEESMPTRTVAQGDM